MTELEYMMAVNPPKFHCDICNSDIWLGRMYTNRDTPKLMPIERCCEKCYKMITRQAKHKKGKVNNNEC